MSSNEFSFSAPLWQWQGAGASWFFVTLPQELSDEIADLAGTGPRAGFGSVRVEVTVGVTSWRTSVFPSKEHGAYILPVKKSVRQAQGLDDGSEVTARITLVNL